MKGGGLLIGGIVLVVLGIILLVSREGLVSLASVAFLGLGILMAIIGLAGFLYGKVVSKAGGLGLLVGGIPLILMGAILQIGIFARIVSAIFQFASILIIVAGIVVGVVGLIGMVRGDRGGSSFDY